MRENSTTLATVLFVQNDFTKQGQHDSESKTASEDMPQPRLGETPGPRLVAMIVEAHWWK